MAWNAAEHVYLVVPFTSYDTTEKQYWTWLFERPVTGIAPGDVRGVLGVETLLTKSQTNPDAKHWAEYPIFDAPLGAVYTSGVMTMFPLLAKTFCVVSVGSGAEITWNGFEQVYLSADEYVYEITEKH